MSELENRRKPDEIAHQWQLLAKRRRDHLLALHRSGRWRKYFSEDQMIAQMRDLVRVIKQWDESGRDDAPALPATPRSALARS
jgi:hypothetical protein